MTDTALETRLARELGAWAETAVAPIDPLDIARRAIAPRTFRRRSFVRLALVAAALLLMGAAVALLAASWRRPPADPILAYVRPDGLYLAASDGSHPRLVLPGAFTDVEWSGDGTTLALVAGEPTGDTTLVIVSPSAGVIGQSRGEGYGNAPISWAPNGRLFLAGVPDVLAYGAPVLQAIAPDGTTAWTSTLPTVGGRQWRVPLTIAWRPDGAWAAVDLRRERNLCHETVLVPATGADHDATLFADQEAAQDCSAHRPAWSHDGARLAMLGGGGSECWPWTPDASACATDLLVFDIDPSDPTAARPAPRVIARNVRAYGQPMWLPGDRELLFARLDGVPTTDPSVALVLAAADGSGERPVGVIDTSDPRITWAVPGRSVLVYARRTSGGSDPVLVADELRSFDLASGESRVLATEVIDAAMQPALES